MSSASRYNFYASIPCYIASSPISFQKADSCTGNTYAWHCYCSVCIQFAQYRQNSNCYPHCNTDCRRISEIIFPLSAFSSVWALSVLICISSSVVIPKISASFGIVLTYGLVPGRITLNRPASPAEFFTPVLLSHE